MIPYLTVLASKQRVSIHPPPAFRALSALPCHHSSLAPTLTVQLVTQPDPADGSVPVTVTVLAALGVGGPQVPEQRLAGVAGPPSDGLFAIAQLTLRDVGTAAHREEILGDSVRVAVTLLTQRVVEPLC